MSKRKRVVLSLEDKINIIDSLKKGETGRKLADKYGVGTSTISDIKKNTDSVLKYICKLDSEAGSKHRKMMKKPKNIVLEEVLYCWFLQRRSTGQPISGPILCEKALQLNKKIGGDESFVASNGWLYRFKSRHGIRELSANVDAINSFKDGFKKKLDENDYDLQFVYNADETGLNWKSLPSKSLASQRENSTPGYKTSKERVTILVCANATGSHKIPLLLIGKSKNPKCFKNIKVPLIYKYQKSAWINSKIFIGWYDNTFIPEVRKYQNEIGKQGKVLLLLDNAPIHPSTELLERENGNFKVIFLPPNVKSLLQPMDQSVITLKRLYRKELLRRLLSIAEDNVEVVMSFHKQMNLKEFCYMVVDAWDLIERKTLSKSWNRLLLREDDNLKNNMDDYNILKEINELMANVHICQGCDADDVKDWLNCDSNDQGFHIMSDDEIVEKLLQVNEKQEKKEDVFYQEVENDAGPSHEEAFQALETALKWFEKQAECDTVSLLQLKRIRDVAAIKRKTGLRQIKKPK